MNRPLLIKLQADRVLTVAQSVLDSSGDLATAIHAALTAALEEAEAMGPVPSDWKVSREATFANIRLINILGAMGATPEVQALLGES